MSGHNVQRLICARDVGGPIRSCGAARIALQAQVPVGILSELRILQGCETYSISDTDRTTRFRFTNLRPPVPKARALGFMT